MEITLLDEGATRRSPTAENGPSNIGLFKDLYLILVIFSLWLSKII